MASKTSIKEIARKRRQKSIRRRLRGTPERPRLCVFRSTRHIYAQIIDDVSGTTLLTVSTQHPSVAEATAGKKKKEQAKIVGQAVAKACLEQSISQVAFDRNGFIYHGRVAAVAEGAREAGLQF